MKTILNLILIITLFSSSKIHSQDLIPLKVNNEWTYLEKIITNNKVKIDTITSKVEKTVTYNNKEWFFLNELGDDFIVRNDELGHHELDTLTTLKNGNYDEVLIFKNFKKNKSTSYDIYDDVKVTKAAGIFKIETPIGKFKCRKYSLTFEFNNFNEVIEFYFTPKIGLIYYKWIEEETTTTCELINYKLE